MSHFTVLVVTKDKPTDDVLSAALQPFHEFECTGENDKHVQDVDLTDEARNRFENREDKSESLVEYMAGWYGWEPVALGSEPDLEGAHKYGYFVVDLEGKLAKAIDRTNPEKKWDWWQIGGRWSGLLLPKPGTESESYRGSPGVLGTINDESGVDVAMKSNVDWERMSRRGCARRRAGVEEALVKVGSATGKTREQLLEIHRCACEAWPAVKSGYGGGVSFYDYLQSLPEGNPVRVARELKLWHGFDALVSEYGAGVPETEPDPVAWANKPEPFSCFAMLRDGRWMERGTMGWWACVSNENSDHDAEFAAALADVPDDHWLTVVDCHI